MLRHLRACSKLIQTGSLRQAYSSRASVTEEMLEYVRSPETKKGISSAQIRDILRGGISQQTGTSAARLSVALAELEFEESRWDEAAHASGLARKLCLDELMRTSGSTKESAAEESTTMEVLDASQELQMRSLLTGSRDEEAQKLSVKYVGDLSPGIQDLLQDDEADSALDYAISTNVRETYSRKVVEVSKPPSFEGLPDAEILLRKAGRRSLQKLYDNNKDVMVVHSTIFQQRSGVIAFLQGDGQAALKHFEAAAVIAMSDKNLKEGKLLSISPHLVQESELAAALGRIQVDLAVSDTQDSWKQCEAPLEKVLDMAEGMGDILGSKSTAGGSTTHPRVIPVLMCLADVYSRTGRVTLAEGLYRTAGKAIYRSQDPASGFAMRDPRPVHPTLAALLAWRYAQLLSALPKRDAEAELWGSHAREVFKAAFPGKAIEEYFGDEERLKGKGAKPKGVFIDSTVRRVLLCTRPVTVNG